MPRLGIVSDLHIESSNILLQDPQHLDGCDILVVPGDVLAGGQSLNAIDVLAHLFPSHPIVFVPGNHEFEHLHIEQAVAQLKQRASIHPNIHVLYNDSLVLDGIRFLGTTLWSSMAVPSPQHAPSIHAKITSRFLDFKAQRDDGTRLTVKEVSVQHQQALEFLRTHLDAPCDYPTVVVTHFPPHEGSSDPKFEGSLFQPWFSNSLDPALLSRCNVWVHGHVHASFDYQIDFPHHTTRVVCNPMGFAQIIPVEDVSPAILERVTQHIRTIDGRSCVVMLENPSRQWPQVVEL